MAQRRRAMATAQIRHIGLIEAGSIDVPDEMWLRSDTSGGPPRMSVDEKQRAARDIGIGPVVLPAPLVRLSVHLPFVEGKGHLMFGNAMVHGYGNTMGSARPPSDVGYVMVKFKPAAEGRSYLVDFCVNNRATLHDWKIEAGDTERLVRLAKGYAHIVIGLKAKWSDYIGAVLTFPRGDDKGGFLFCEVTEVRPRRRTP